MPTTNRRAGFTLIEAMMASMVLALCVVGLSSALMAATKNQDLSGRSFTALEAARSGMENLATQHLSDLSPASGSTTTETIPVESLGADDSGAVETGKLTYITRGGSQGTRDVAIISVTAQMPGGQIVKLQRLVTRAENSK